MELYTLCTLYIIIEKYCLNVNDCYFMVELQIIIFSYIFVCVYLLLVP